MQSYDYTNRDGVEAISWERFAALTAVLSEKIAPLQPDIIIGVARAGLFPATAVACHLRAELYPVRITRRLNDIVTFDHPLWRVDVPEAVSGQTVVVIDEIADTGESLALVKARVADRGAVRVITATLVAHSWASPMPDHTTLVSDALVIFPWDSQVLIDGRWQPHPELVAALNRQDKEPDDTP